MKRVLIVDDLPEARAMLLEAIRGAFPEAACVLAGGVQEALRTLTECGFDLALVDLALGDGNGVEVIARLAATQPDCVIVVATILDDDDNLFQALQAGAQGYLLKDHPRDWLSKQLLGIADGQPPLSPAIARRLLRHFHGVGKPDAADGAELSVREREVLSLLAKGIRIADIAVSLAISRHTVGDHVKKIYRKLNISSRAEAALHARSLGLI